VKDKSTSFKSGVVEVVLNDAQQGTDYAKKAFSGVVLKRLDDVKKIRFVEEHTRETEKKEPAKEGQKEPGKKTPEYVKEG